jgi:hypothetical protein
MNLSAAANEMRSASARLVCVVGVLLVSGGVPTSAGATTLAPDPEDPGLQAAAAGWYASHYAVSTSTAYDRLQIQDAASVVLPKVTEALGDRWAGAWFDATDSGRLKLAVVASDSVPTGAGVTLAKNILSTNGVDQYSDLVAVPSSWSDLADAQADVDRQLADLLAGGRITTSLDVSRNSVVIDTVNDLRSDETTAIRSAAEAAPVAIDTRVTDRPTLYANTAACAFLDTSFNNELFCDPPLRGGVVIGGSQKLCTAGLKVRGRSGNQPWLLTAGHCVADAPGQVWQTRFANGSLHDIGKYHSYHFGMETSSTSGTDWALITINNPSGWNTSVTPSVWVGLAPGNQTTKNENYPIYQSAYPAKGTTVCGTSGFPLPGSQSSYHTYCGDVTQENVTADVPGPAGGFITLTGLTRTNLCTGRGGASGGPLYKSNNGYGILSSYYADCDTLYQRMGTALTGSNTYIG